MKSALIAELESARMRADAAEKRAHALANDNMRLETEKAQLRGELAAALKLCEAAGRRDAERYREAQRLAGVIRTLRLAASECMDAQTDVACPVINARDVYLWASTALETLEPGEGGQRG